MTQKASLGWSAGERFWQCTEHVFTGERCDVRGHQCSKSAKHDPDDDGNPTKCSIHSAAGKEKRRQRQAERDAEWRAKWDRDTAMRDLRKEAHDIIRRIADGHNDPRSLCADWVKRWGEVQ